jgi:hypothetical protein
MARLKRPESDIVAELRARGGSIVADSFTYPLRYPIAMQIVADGGPRTVTIDWLVCARRVKGRHMRKTDGAEGPAGFKLLLVAALCGITPDEADELDQDDIDAVSELLDCEGDGPLADGSPGATGGPKTGSALSET